MGEKYDILGQLPIETSQKLLMYITPESLGNVSKCCKKWKNIMRGSYFWKNKSEQDYNFAGLEYVESEFYRKYVQNFSDHWQGHYIYNCELEHRWRNGLCLCKKYCVDGFSGIKRFVYMDDDILVVAKEHEICIINISNLSIEKTFQAKFLDQAVVEKSEGLLIALCDRFWVNSRNWSSLILKVWDLKSKETLVKFEHKLVLSFSKFFVYKHLIAFIIEENLDEENEGEREREDLHIFNIKTGSYDYKRRQVPCMCFDNDTIAFVSGVNVIEIMDMNFKVIMKLTCCDDKFIDNIRIKNNHLLVESERHHQFNGINRLIEFICVWDLTTKAKLFTLEDKEFVDMNFINDNKIICLKQNNLAENWVECWSLPHFVTQKFGHYTATDIMYTSNNRFLFTEITQTSLKMWCPRTHKLIRSFDLKKFNIRRSFKCRIGQIDILMVSNKNLAYIEIVGGRDIVHIMDFGPDIKNKITFS